MELKLQGKTYKQIADIIGCSEWTVKYHTMPCRKNAQNNYYKKCNKIHPLLQKKKRFMIKGTIVPFSINELKEKIGNSPRCYLTGEPIDLLKPETYSLDHKLPISRGGKSSLENCELLKSEINQSKYNLTPEEFFKLCQRVVNGRPAR
jgi:5-methylcytosine-specific restriction endonuclease McrA